MAIPLRLTPHVAGLCQATGEEWPARASCAFSPEAPPPQKISRGEALEQSKRQSDPTAVKDRVRTGQAAAPLTARSAPAATAAAWSSTRRTLAICRPQSRACLQGARGRNWLHGHGRGKAGCGVQGLQARLIRRSGERRAISNERPKQGRLPSPGSHLVVCSAPPPAARIPALPPASPPLHGTGCPWCA